MYYCNWVGGFLREPGDRKWVIGGVLYVEVNLLYRLRTYCIDGIFSSNDYCRGLRYSGLTGT